MILPQLEMVRLRLTMRLLGDARLPAFKGSLLRGGFGYAFQRATCPAACWGNAHACEAPIICPYRWVFATPHPPEVAELHDLQDVPRPFVVRLGTDERTTYRAGEALEFQVTLLGRGIDYLPFFLFGFAHLGERGLGAARTPARLERVEALEPWRPTGPVIYQDGRLITPSTMPSIDGPAISARASELPDTLQLTIASPLRIKSRGHLMERIDLPAIIRATAWRLDTLALFHGGGAWGVNHHELAEAARVIKLEREHVRWEDRERQSDGRHGRQRMHLGGLVGSVILHDVPRDLRTLLVAASIIQIGKACVFGNGVIDISAISDLPLHNHQPPAKM
ncbi:CRISPR system precrRNA processing endoribonuclease RAMP protein Cas6 [Candidatus Chloroploca sp. Khr17]|uniref:CRISPR system precrRNA processing endoribonuclease RAMP protein Cas6 n=1 Tax=Candidatus Chloroploca sp. Khr17 TaxID=2496869 RepID=UPI001F0D7C6D|nr:CRISPR system precrRNA processing endoribonuclease RAMP protein Cas6 [Candidatus Chloroploca sp. Khr17]